MTTPITQSAYIDPKYLDVEADVVAIGRNALLHAAAAAGQDLNGPVTFVVGDDSSEHGVLVTWASTVVPREVLPGAIHAAADGSVQVPAHVTEGGGLIPVAHRLGLGATVTASAADGTAIRPKMVVEVFDDELEVHLPPGVVTLQLAAADKGNDA